MLIKEEKFQNLYKSYIIIKNKKFSHQIGQSMQIDSVYADDLSSEDLKERISSIKIPDEINAIFAIAYVDHTRGLSFFTLSIASVNGKSVDIFKREDFSALSIFRKSEVNDCEFEYLENLDCNGEFDIKTYEEFAKIIDNYHVNDNVETLRQQDWMNKSRNADYPDDVIVQFIKKDFEVEGMWVRYEDIDEDGFIKGELLNTPYQDFGIKSGDTVEIFPYELDEETIILVCDLNKRE